MTTRVSVVVPVHNGARYLSACLESVRAQSHPPAEIIVVDDGSTDQSASIAESFGVSLWRQPQRGPGAARNRGVAESTGEVLAFLDADDLWAPEKLEWQLTAFEENPALDLVSGQVQNFWSPELDPDLRQRIGFAPDPVPGMHPGAILVRRDAWQRVGAFSEELCFGDFIPWLARAQDLGLETRFLDRAVMFRRIHESNFSRTHPQHRRDYLAAAKQVLDRRRGRV
jgi:glycosyltransferase involved in cell wall biosynthesis